MDREQVYRQILEALSKFGYSGVIRPKLGRTESRIEFTKTDRQFQQHMKALGWSEFKGDFKEWSCVKDGIRIRVFWMGKTFLTIDSPISQSGARVIISMNNSLVQKGIGHGN